jgi:hypothetical protein
MLFPEPLSSAPKPSLLLKSVAGKSPEKTDEDDSSRETFNDSQVDSSEENSDTQKVEDIQTVNHFENLSETEENDDVSVRICDISSIGENGNRVITEIAVQDAPVDEPEEVAACKTPSLQEHSNVINSKESDVSRFMNVTSSPVSSIPSVTSVQTAVTVASTCSVTNSDNTATSTTSPVVTLALTTTTESSVGEAEKNVCDTRQDISGPAAGGPLEDDARNAPLNTKCRIPVRLGEPTCLKSSVQEADDLHNKPSTCTQNKPTVGNSVFSPTPQQPECNSPTSLTPVSSKYVTPKSPTSVTRTGTKIPSLLPSVSHGQGKADITSQPQNNSLSSSEKVPSPDSKFPSPSSSLNHGASSVLPSSWPSSVSEAESLSDFVSGTKIPQPGFYSSSPLSQQSSKRGSVSSQSSSSSRPGSIAPLLNTSMDSSTSPVIKELGYNYINKPRFSATDHNLNISSKIPTATPLSSSHLNPQGDFSGLEDTSLHGNSKLALLNEQSLLVSKIPTLSSPSPARLGSVPQRLFSTPAAESSPRTSSECPGRQAKTWMFGPHKNATVVSANSTLKLLIIVRQVGQFLQISIKANYGSFCEVLRYLLSFRCLCVYGETGDKDNLVTEVR